jgi:hypothetical protein
MNVWWGHPICPHFLFKRMVRHGKQRLQESAHRFPMASWRREMQPWPGRNRREAVIQCDWTSVQEATGNPRHHCLYNSGEGVADATTQRSAYGESPPPSLAETGGALVSAARVLIPGHSFCRRWIVVLAWLQISLASSPGSVAVLL